jgi:two-component system, cell cycle response regulator DivK
VTSSVAISDPPDSLVALLVDRDQDTRRMYAEYLKLGNWRVDEASDGREALAKAIALHPDVIITETRLPGIDGITLCGLLRRDVATNAIPVVFVTGDAYPADVERAMSAGGDLVLTKPCLPEDLLTRLRTVLADAQKLRTRAAAVRLDATAIRLDALDHLERADEVLSRSVSTIDRHLTLKKAHRRGDTINPPVAPPTLVCPLCDRPLTYRRSHVGGVSSKHSEQWDYFDCDAGCGTFQYRVRTRKLRKVG